MNGNPETYRGAVAAWQTDFFGHLNVRHYVGMFDEATWNFFAAFGVTRDWFVDSNLGIFAVRHEIDYRRELHAGDVVVVTSSLLELGERKLWVEHRLREAVSGEEAAVMVLVAVCVDRGSGRSCPIPDDIRARAREMLAVGAS